jgi:ATP-dependent Lhr-like helicase
VISAGANTLVFPWIGTRALNTLALLLRSLGFGATPQDLSIEVRSTTPEETMNALVQIDTGDSQDAESIAALVENKVTEKHHHYLREELLTADYAAAHLDVASAICSARDIVAASHPKDDL